MSQVDSPSQIRQPTEEAKEVATYYLGRPSKYPQVWVPETKQRALEHCAQGAGVVELCVYVLGITPDTFYEWMDAKGKEDFSNTMKVGYFLAKAWWMRQGRENLHDRNFNTRLFEFNMRNRYGWAGLNPSEDLPRGPGGEEDENAGVRDQVDVDKIIADAERYARENAIDVEFTEVKAEAEARQADRPAKKPEAKKKPPLPPGLRAGPRKKAGKKKAGKKASKKKATRRK